MTLVVFFLGLAVGVGFWLLQQLLLQRQLQRLLAMLPSDVTEASLPKIVRLRRGIAIANEQRQQLVENLQIWQQILQVAPVGYLQVDEENQLLWCNQQARQMLNIQHWEPERSRLLLKVVRSYELDQLIEQTRQSQQTTQQEWVFHPAIADAEAVTQSRALTLRGTAWPLPAGQVGVFLENRQEIVDNSAARNRWVSDLAHELRTPLTSIRLVAEALVERLQPPARVWVERMLTETNRLIQLVQDWLELMQLEADPSNKLTRKPIELGALIQSAWQTLEPLTSQKQLSLAYSATENFWIEADESSLFRVFLNLFDNSIRYSPSKGTIQVNVTVSPVSPFYLQIDLIDSGPGFPEADLPRVFERLYRAENSRARSIFTADSPSPQAAASSASPSPSSGSGLGLAIVRQIILAHGGSITAKNHPQTGGAWLSIQLPYQQSAVST